MTLQRVRAPGGSARRSIERGDDVRPDVLELVRDDAAFVREPQRRGDVVVGADLDPVGDRGGGTVGIRVEDDDPVADRRGPRAPSIRPSWPPPRMPIVAGGRIGSGCVSVVTTPDDSVSR